MSKLIWWLGVMIACLMNSVEPFHMDEVGFIINHYYTSTLGEDNPQSIYQQFFNTDMDVQPCSPTPNDLSVYSRYTNGGKAFTINELKYYMLGLPEDKQAGYATYNLAEGEIYPLVAPIPLMVTLSPADSNFSTYMTLTGVGEFRDYTIEIIGMECWYCCIGHTKFDGANYQHQFVDKDSYTKQIKGGQCLGLANSKTQVVIKQKGKKISFDEFYGTTSITANLDANRPATE